MITRKEIIFKMSLDEIPFSTLYHELNKYVIISRYEVNTIIDKGVDDPEIKGLVAYILGMKEHMPDGFKPKTRSEKLEDKKARPFGEVKDYFKSSRPRMAVSDPSKEAVITQAEINGKKRSFIRRLVESLGGGIAVTKKMGCTRKTVYNWTKEVRGFIYIPPRYINQVIELLPKEDMEHTFDVLINMMPESKQDLYFRANKKADLPIYRYGE